MRLSLCEAPTLKEQHKGQPQHRETSRPTNYQNKFSLKYLPSWGKLLIGRQVMFELRRLLEQGDLCQVLLELRQLIDRHPFLYRSNISPADSFCIWRQDQVSH